MARVQTLPPRLSPEEYLEGERIAELRHEFVDGFVYAMSGTTEAHNDIQLYLTGWLGSRLPAGCRVFSGSVKLMTKPTDDTSYYYPDVFVSCGPRDPRGYVRREASLIVEILSPPTERTDRGEKFLAYTAMPSVMDYMLVSQEGARVEVFRRTNGWQRETYATGDVIQLDSLAQPLPVSEVYRDILF